MTEIRPAEEVALTALLGYSDARRYNKVTRQGKEACAYSANMAALYSRRLTKAHELQRARHLFPGYANCARGCAQ